MQQDEALLEVRSPGEEVKLRYQWRGPIDEHPVAGDVLESRTGRRYLVVHVSGRHDQAGRVLGRLTLKCLVMHPDDEYPEGARVSELVWDKRRARA